jgi:tRNA-2-methylthio-N6-dimethylallyladenosine synthase
MFKKLETYNNNSTKVYIKTYGCQMNKLDSELSVGLLAKSGYAFAEDEKEIVSQ